MPALELPSRCSTGLLLSLTLCCGCQRSLPRVAQRHFDPAAPTATPQSPSLPTAGEETPPTADGGWRSTAASPAFSTNGIPLSPEAPAVVPLSPATAATAAVTVTGLETEPTAPSVTPLVQPAESPPAPPGGTPAAEIHQTQYLAGATDRDMETLRQRLEQQTQVNAAMTQAIIQLQRQAEAHHKTIVQLADELNARQARQDKVTEEILSLIDQMAGGAPRPRSPAQEKTSDSEAAGAGPTGTGAAASGGDSQ